MAKATCEKCGADMKSVRLEMYGESFFARECGCGHRIISLEVAMRLHDKIAPRLSVRKRIIRIGQSSALTIPKEIRHFFLPGQSVSLSFEPREMEIRIRKDAA